MDQTDVALRAVIKALNEIVAPAVDPGDYLAQEQLRLSAEYIGFLRHRLGYLHGRERFDLAHQLELAGCLESGLPPGHPALAALRLTTAPARAALADPAALTPELRDLALELGYSVAAAVRALEALPAPEARQLRQQIPALTGRRIEVERIWYAPIGFEPVPLDDGPLASSLAGSADVRPSRG